VSATPGKMREKPIDLVVFSFKPCYGSVPGRTPIVALSLPAPPK
jgi:hypothetical protein